MVMLHFKTFLQYDTVDCGPACLVSIFRYYGLKVSISEIKDICGTDREGTSAKGLVKAIEHYHYQHRVVTLKKQDLSSDIPLPAVANIVTPEGMLHYVVVIKISNEYIRVSDPAKGIVKYERDSFIDMWTGTLLLIAPGDESVKGNYEKNNLWSFCRLLLAQKRSVVFIILLSVACTGIGVMTSYYYRLIMDQAIPSLSLDYLRTVSLGVIFLYLVQIGLGVVRSIIVTKYEQKLDLTITLGYYHHSLMLPMRFYVMRDTGDIISRFNDADNVRALISETTIGVFMDAFMAVAGAIILCRFNYKMFFIAFLIIFVYSVIVFSYTKPLMRLNRELLEDGAKITSKFIETITGMETIKSYNSESKQYDKTSHMYRRLMKKSFKTSMISLSEGTIISIVSSIGGVLILWVGTIGVINGNMTLGELITFNALLGYFISPVTSLINLQPTIQAATVAVNRLGEVLDCKSEYDINNEGFCFSELENVRVDNVTFAYGTRKPVLRNVSLYIKSGQKIGFVGDSGSGKTTLAKLLVGLYDVSSGNIDYNGIGIKDIYKPLLRKQVLYLPQDVFLQNGTIKENIIYERSNIEDDYFRHICRLCGIDEIAAELPLGYQTLIEENGKNLSGGQKQRIAIARALIGKPQLLIMDEATSSLDNISERIINRAIRESTKDITTIMISHRLSAIKDCDRIYVFDNGSIIEEGEHDEMLARRGKYYDLWNGKISE